jgi:ferrous iron transport protein B
VSVPTLDSLDRGQRARIVDVSGDDAIAVRLMEMGLAEVGAIDAVVCIADASNLERNLYLLSQVLDLQLPSVLVLNMADVARSRGVTIDVELLR